MLHTWCTRQLTTNLWLLQSSFDTCHYHFLPRQHPHPCPLCCPNLKVHHNTRFSCLPDFTSLFVSIEIYLSAFPGEKKKDLFVSFPSWGSPERKSKNEREVYSIMAMLLKKVWESVSNRASSCSSSSDESLNPPGDALLSSLGAFDRIPIDVVMQIVRLLGPKDAARLSVVCKSWRSLVSDNRLWIYFLQNYHDSWDSVFFAETNLRSGYPIQWVSFLFGLILSSVWVLSKCTKRETETEKLCSSFWLLDSWGKEIVQLLFIIKILCY